MAWGTTCAKYLLFIFNCIFLVGGLLLVILGAIIKIKAESLKEYFGHNSLVPAILLIVIGLITFIISFLGCCGVFKESYCMLITFSSLLGIIFLVQLVAGILVLVYPKDIEKFLKMKIDDALENYKENSTSVHGLDIDLLQRNLHCCGSNSSSDWESTTYGHIPNSCKCKEKYQHGPKCNDEGYYKQGCFQLLKENSHLTFIILGGIAIALALIEILGIILGCTLGKSFKEPDTPILDFTSYY